MFSDIVLYARYLAVSMRGQMQYRASLVMQSIANLLGSGIEFIGIWALFSRFGTLRGWALCEVGLFYGVVNVSFAIADALMGGFDLLASTIRSGEFDRVLVRPRSVTLQVAAREVQLRRAGSFLQGLVVLLWSAWALQVEWTVARLALLTVTVAAGACFFSGLFMLQATMAFWTIESLEVMNTLTYGGRDTAQYPLSIYQRWFRRFFTFAVPVACVGYYPVLVIAGRPDPLGAPAILGWLTPWAGIAFLLVCLRVFGFGVRHYRSTGS